MKIKVGGKNSFNGFGILVWIGGLPTFTLNILTHKHNACCENRENFLIAFQLREI
jgi:hypothetical protein